MFIIHWVNGEMKWNKQLKQQNYLKSFLKNIL